MSEHRLSADEVEAVARLARLSVAPAEVEDLRTRLSAVLGHAGRLAELDLAGVTPLTHAVEIVNRFGDEPGPVLDTGAALDLAPVVFERFYRVPKVIGEGGGA